MEPNTIFATREGSLGAVKTIEMDIDPLATAHLMSVLTNLYADPELAVIREISTNALDSHVEAGQTRPIEITLPNKFTPFFKVKDYGLGMSVDDIETIYARYGASTKRGSNTQVGMLGLGCKAPLTYTNQFNLVAVKGGVKTTVSIGRNESGVGIMEIVDTCATTEPNGVEIIIPVKMQNNFGHKAAEFFKFWKPGTVLVNGAQPEQIKGKMVGNIMMVDGSTQDYIVMGSVAYPVDNSHSLYAPYRQNRFGLVAFVEIGDIEFVPSRESLHYTRRTKEKIDSLAKEFTTNLTDIIQKDIDSEKTPAEAYKKVIAWKKMVGNTKFMDKITYKGATIPMEFKGRFLKYMQHYARYNVRRFDTISHIDFQHSVIVYNFKAADVTTTHKKKMRMWGESDDAPVNPSAFILCEQIPGTPWLDAVAVDWDEIAKIKISTPKPKTPRGTGYFVPVFDAATGCYVDTDVIDGTKEIVYSSPKEHCSGANLTQIFPDAIIVEMGQNRWDKFLRLFPHAKHWRPLLKEKLTEAAKALSEDDKISLSVDYYFLRRARALAAAKIEDPEIAKWLDLALGAAKKSPEVIRWEAISAFCPRYGMTIPDVRVPNPMSKKYPLIDQYGEKNVKHVILYLNAAYNEFYKEKNATHSNNAG